MLSVKMICINGAICWWGGVTWEVAGLRLRGCCWKGDRKVWAEGGGDRGRRGSTHICGPVPSVVPNVIHQGGEVLQALRDVVRKEQDAHCLRTSTQSQRWDLSLVSILTLMFLVLSRLTVPEATTRCKGCTSSVWSRQLLWESQQSSLVCNQVSTLRLTYAPLIFQTPTEIYSLSKMQTVNVPLQVLSMTKISFIVKY